MTTQNEARHTFDPYTSRPVCGYYEEPSHKLPIVADVDVLVVGGSQSGCAAAISAARHGAKVMLVERYGFLGGQSVYSSVVQWEKRAFINNLGAVATRGIAKEMVERIVAKGDSDGLWTTPPCRPRCARTMWCSTWSTCSSISRSRRTRSESRRSPIAGEGVGAGIPPLLP